VGIVQVNVGENCLVVEISGNCAAEIYVRMLGMGYCPRCPNRHQDYKSLCATAPLYLSSASVSSYFMALYKCYYYYYYYYSYDRYHPG